MIYGQDSLVLGMKTPYLSGVYCLKAVNSKLIYIGSTNSLGKRKTVHMYNIRRYATEKGCKSIMDAYYAGDFIEFEVIEICDNYTEREQYWIEFYRKQDTYKLVNQFDAERQNSRIKDSFREKMSQVLKERWKNPEYRKIKTGQNRKTQFSSERLSKVVHLFTLEGEYCKSYNSAKSAAFDLKLSKQSVCAAARGKYRGKFTHKRWIFVYDEVLNKLDELLEAHQELRVISSEAREAINSTVNVQRLTSEQVSNNLDTSVQHLL